MANIKPFRALRYTEKAGDIAKNVCPPYDIINEEQRLRYLAASEYNIIRLELPKGENAYRHAGETYVSFRERGILARDEKEGLYIYEEEFSVFGEIKRIKGVFARVRLAEFSEKIILPHEETLSKAKTDRFNLMSATYCNFSPVYSMYSDPQGVIARKLDDISQKKPEVEFADGGGIIQRLWIADLPDDLLFVERAFSDKQLFIADGHHRYETALHFKKKLISDGVITDGDHAGNFVMMFLVDLENEGLVVFPTHRLIKDLPSFHAERALAGIREYFDAAEIKKEQIESSLSANSMEKAYVFYADRRYFLLTLKQDGGAPEAMRTKHPDQSDAYRNLDVSLLHSLVLENVFGIDRANMANQLNLAYTRDYDEAISRVDSGECDCCFLLNPTKVTEIKDVALANDKMPQKSTYFYPKIITGLVMNEIIEPK